MATATLNPTADSSTESAGWAAEGGDYSRLTSDDGDTSRLYTPTNNDTFFVELSNPSLPAGAVINSVKVYAKVRSLDPVSNTMQIGVKVSGTNYWSSNKDTDPSTSYTLFSETWATNPNTASAWTESEVNALEAGRKKTNTVGMGWTYMYVEVDYTVATLEQEGFAFGDDDGNESSHTLDTQDTNVTEALGTKTLRTIINASGDPSSKSFKLKFQKDGSGGYEDVPVGATSGGDDLVIESGDCTQSDTNATDTTFDMTIPAYAVGDLVIINAGVWEASGATQSVSFPSGPDGETITVIDNDYSGSGAADKPCIAIGYYIATDAYAGGTITLTASDASARWNATAIIVPAGEFDSSTPISANDTQDNSGVSDVSSIDMPAFSAASDDGGGKLIVFGSADQTAWSSSMPSGYTQLVNDDAGRVAIVVAGRDSAVTDSESISAATFSSSGSDALAIFAYIVRTAPETDNEVYISASGNVASGGEATTARLTAPSGKTTGDFTTGRRWDDENGSDSIDIAEDEYTELEWVLTTQSPATATDYFEFRVYDSDSALDTYTVTPRWTIAASTETATPSPVTATWSVVTPTATFVETATPDPVSAAFSVPAPTATYTFVETTTPDPVEATWSVPAVTATFHQTATPEPVEAAWSVPEVTTSYVYVETANPSPVSAAWSVVNPTASYIFVETASVSPVSAAWSIPAVTASMTETATVTPVTAAWTVPSVTAQFTETATVSPVTAEWAVNPVTATFHQTAVTSAVSASWVIPSVASSYTFVETASPDPVSASWSVVSPTTTFRITTGPSPVSASWSVPSVVSTFVETAALSPVTAAWSILSVSTSTGTIETATPDPVTANWSIPNVTISFTVSTTPSPVSAAWSVVSVTATETLPSGRVIADRTLILSDTISRTVEVTDTIKRTITVHDTISRPVLLSDKLTSRTLTVRDIIASKNVIL